MKTCYLIHGIKTGNPQRSTISFLKYILPNFYVKILEYGYLPAIAAPIISILNYFIVKELADKIWPNQIIIGHSNGCTIAHGISKSLRVFGLVLINPALDSDVKFDDDLKFIHIYYSKKDRVTWLSKFVPFSKWGAMGTVGYQGEDPRVKQWETGIDHTDIGSAEIAMKWGPLIAANLNAEISKFHPA